MRKHLLVLALFALGCAPAGPKLTAYGVALGDTPAGVETLLGKPGQVNAGRDRFPGMDLVYANGVVVLMETDQLEMDGKVFQGSKAIRDGLLQAQPDRRGASPGEIYVDSKTDTEVSDSQTHARVELKRIPSAGPAGRGGTIDPPGGTPAAD